MARNEFPVRIENAHVVVDETGRQDRFEHTERVVDAKCVRRLAKADARDVESRATLDQHDLGATLGECGCSGEPADASAHHQHATNFVHDRATQCRAWQTASVPRARKPSAPRAASSQPASRYVQLPSEQAFVLTEPAASL